MANLTDNAKVTILLCSTLGLKDDIKPFTAIQWYNLGVKIYNSDLKEPAALIGLNEDTLINKLGIASTEALRITKLLSRSINVAFELQRLEAKGINIVTKSDANYPKRLVKILGGRYAPPMLYYSGNLELAKGDSIGIVGSRNIDSQGMLLCTEIAKKAAGDGITVVSGGARGIDSTSRISVLQNGGTCIEFLADSMAKKIVQEEYLKPILAGKLLVFSTVSPDLGFSVASAMNRNKYIYALAKKTFAIAADLNKGGTWAGATEAIKKKWGNVFVLNTDRYSGNKALINSGATSFSTIAELDFSNLTQEEVMKNSVMDNLFEQPADTKVYMVSDNVSDYNQESGLANEQIYRAVLPIIKGYLKKEHTKLDIIKALNIVPKQAEEWLKKAVDDKQIKKLIKPVRYIAVDLR
ncbi:DNA-processing protein DprA [uncultured Phascolarctobacterium sp.]|uniref:DNA-processing protein DprA n=1 Tax=uncultured Phascolarctobacterium sp. TaxID=512296 RepID=UPI0025F658C7|nr:DNA-processing protein DprA [uncultured Phascolarctobacterium sp.]